MKQSDLIAVVVVVACAGAVFYMYEKSTKPTAAATPVKLPSVTPTPVQAQVGTDVGSILGSIGGLATVGGNLFHNIFG